MTATIDAIVTRVERRLIDLPTAITTESIILVNEAIRVACKLHNFHQMQSEVAFTTVDATRKLGNVPTDFKEQRDRPYLREGELGILGQRKLRKLASLEEALRDFSLDDPNDDGRPQGVLREYVASTSQDEFWVFPFPDTSSNWDNGLFRVVVPYWAYPVALITTESNFYTNNWEEYLVAQGTAKGFSLALSTNRAAEWQTEADKELKILIRADKRAKLERDAVLGVHRDVYASQAQGRM